MTEHVKYLKNKYNVSFDLTHLVTAEHCQNQIDAVLKLRANGLIDKLIPKQRVFINLVLQAYDNEGVEGFLREAFRYVLREQLNVELPALMINDDEERVKVSPVKVVHNVLSVGSPE